ncbi:hypothetical protein [Actinomadura logoneensis]|uniref:hypothetical protein n=1 Tax=Actinomadura logoneensis TaxID=2293572 RepID=UPI001F454729|nr:hypothetical protein [Actinomadura logoneensis]
MIAVMAGHRGRHDRGDGSVDRPVPVEDPGPDAVDLDVQVEDLPGGEQHLARGAPRCPLLRRHGLPHGAELRQEVLGEEGFRHRVRPVDEDESGHGVGVPRGVVHGQVRAQ